MLAWSNVKFDESAAESDVMCSSATPHMPGLTSTAAPDH